MPIPMSDGQRRVQAPSLGNAKAVDVSPMVAKSFDAALHTINVMDKAANSAAGYLMQRQQMDDWNAANDALLQYNQNMSDLNAELQTKKGQNAVDFEAEYNRKAEQYHEQFKTGLRTVASSEIREGARSKVNNFNLNNRTSTFGYFDTQRKDVMKEKSNAVINAVEQGLVTSQINALAPDNLRRFEDAVNTIESQLYAIGAIDGEAREATEIKVAQRRVKLASMTARKLDEDNYNLGAEQPFASSINFLRQMKGKMPERERKELLTSRLSKQIALDVTRHPEIFLKNGKFDPKTRKTIAPELDQYEYEQLLGVIRNASAKNSSAPESAAVYGVAIRDAMIRDNKIWLRNHSFIPEDEEKQITKNMSEEDKKEFKARQAELHERISPQEYLDHLFTLHQAMKEEVIVDANTGRSVTHDEDGYKLRQPLLTEDQIKEGLRNGSLRSVFPLDRSSDFYKEVVKPFEDLTNAAIGYDMSTGKGTNVSEPIRDDRNIIKRIFTLGRQYKNKDVGLLAIYGTYYNQYKEQEKIYGEGYSALNVTGIIQAYEKYRSLTANGGYVYSEVPTPLVDKNTNLYLRKIEPVNAESNFDSDTNQSKADVFAAVHAALVSTYSGQYWNDMTANSAAREIQRLATMQEHGAYPASEMFAHDMNPNYKPSLFGETKKEIYSLFSGQPRYIFDINENR